MLRKMKARGQSCLNRWRKLVDFQILRIQSDAAERRFYFKTCPCFVKARNRLNIAARVAHHNQSMYRIHSQVITLKVKNTTINPLHPKKRYKINHNSKIIHDTSLMNIIPSTLNNPKAPTSPPAKNRPRTRSGKALG